MGLRLGGPVDNGPKAGDYSGGVTLPGQPGEKGKSGSLASLSPLSLSHRLPRQSSPPPVPHYLQGALA